MRYVLSCEVEGDKLETVLSVLAGEVNGIWVQEAQETQQSEIIPPQKKTFTIKRKRIKHEIEETGLGILALNYAKSRYPAEFNLAELGEYLARFGYCASSAASTASSLLRKDALVKKWRGYFLANPNVEPLDGPQMKARRPTRKAMVMIPAK